MFVSTQLISFFVRLSQHTTSRNVLPVGNATGMVVVCGTTHKRLLSSHADVHLTYFTNLSPFRCFTHTHGTSRSPNEISLLRCARASSKTRQVPQALFALVNLARLSLSGTRVGPVQGARLETKLRLDTLTVNPNASPPPQPPEPASDPEQGDMQERRKHKEKQQHRPETLSPPSTAASLRLLNRNGDADVSTTVPASRLPELREKVVHLPHACDD